MVAQCAKTAFGEITPRQIEVRLGYKVYQVTRVQKKVAMRLCVGDGLRQRLLLFRAENGRIGTRHFLFPFVLVRIGCREVRIGDVQNGERPLRARLNRNLFGLDLVARYNARPRRQSRQRKRTPDELTSRHVMSVHIFIALLRITSGTHTYPLAANSICRSERLRISASNAAPTSVTFLPERRYFSW